MWNSFISGCVCVFLFPEPPQLLKSMDNKIHGFWSPPFSKCNWSLDPSERPCEARSDVSSMEEKISELPRYAYLPSEFIF